jgi:transposase
LLHAVVHPADIQDRDGGVLVLSTLFGMFPFLLKLFADGGYQGPQFRMAVAKLLPQLSVEIVKRSDQAAGFTVLPRRWVVERTLAWLGRCRRLSKDFENLTRTAVAFLRLASIRLMVTGAKPRAVGILGIPPTRDSAILCGCGAAIDPVWAEPIRA